jgi:hypothetical protein
MKRGPRPVIVVAALVWCSAMAARPSMGPPEARRVPRLLSQTGLYSARGTVAPVNLPYAPQYALWSDGAQKSRWIFLPPGTKIDVTEIDTWMFPVGTRFWKEFAFGGRKVETRMIWKAGASDWVYATYLWKDDESDAVLAPAAGVPDYYEVAPGKRHSIPGVSDCRDCHENRTKGVLGFTALQLSTDRDPLAPHAESLQPGMVTLQTLVERGLLSPARPDLATSPPRIRAGNPRTRAVLGYFVGNCAHCHTTGSSISALGLSLAHWSATSPDAPEDGFSTTVGQPSRWQLPVASHGDTKRIVPGAPDQSALLYRMVSRSPSSQMPPLGTVLVDREAVDLVRRWIAEDLPQMAPPGK